MPNTRSAPTYASLFMGMFEETYIIPKKRNSIMMYVRYIDDIFLIWKGSEEDLRKFLSKINEVHHSIKVDRELSRKSINFLDCKVSLTGNRLSSAVVTKPTDQKSYLHAKSYHPKSTKEAIAYERVTRLRRICMDDKDFWKAADKLCNDLVKRGYREDQISC